MAHDPVGHETAVGTAGDTYPVGISIGVLRQGVVQEVHQILIVDGAVLAADVGEGLALAVTTSGVAEDDKIAVVGPHLHLVVVDVGEGCAGAAVDVEDHGELLAGLIVGGLHDPAVDIGLAVVDQRLQSNDIVGLTVLRVEAGDGFAVEVELREVVAVHTNPDRVAVEAVKAVAGAGGSEGLTDVALGVHGVEIISGTHGSDKEDLVAIQHDALAAAQSGVGVKGATANIVIVSAQELGLTTGQRHQEHVAVHAGILMDVGGLAGEEGVLTPQEGDTHLTGTGLDEAAHLTGGNGIDIQTVELGPHVGVGLTGEENVLVVGVDGGGIEAGVGDRLQLSGGPPVQAHTHTPAGGNALVVGPEGVVLKGVAALLVVGLGHFLALFNGGGVEILAPAVAEGGQQKQIVVDPADSGGRHGQAEGLSGLAAGDRDLVKYSEVAVLLGQFLVVLAPLGGEEQRVIVGPAIALGITAHRQLPDIFSVAVGKVEVPGVAVAVQVRSAHYEGDPLSVRGEAGRAHILELQKGIGLDLFFGNHDMSPFHQLIKYREAKSTSKATPVASACSMVYRLLC